MVSDLSSVFDAPAAGLGQLVTAFANLWPDGSIFSYPFNVSGVLAVLMVCLVCGTLGALVVGNRMAFFSDALAHCAFAGVALGLLLVLLTGGEDADLRRRITLVMVCFGVVIGVLIAYVRERTGLASDTVIGVFFAGAVGLGAVFTKMFSERRQLFNIENFIFGNPVATTSADLLALLLLVVGTLTLLGTTYNAMILASVSPSLASSRRVPVRLYQYLLIILLGVVVNLSQQIVGTLLINGLLIVPAATAANLAGNLRQMFWLSVGLALTMGLAGYVLSWEVTCHVRPIGISGTVLVLGVALFALSMIAGPLLRRRAATHRPAVEPTKTPAA